MSGFCVIVVRTDNKNMPVLPIGGYDSWSGIGRVVAGMARQGHDLELRRYDGRGWRAMLFPEGFEHSLTSHACTGWAPSPWAAVQRAASDALNKLESPKPAAPDWTVIDESPLLGSTASKLDKEPIHLRCGQIDEASPPK